MEADDDCYGVIPPGSLWKIPGHNNIFVIIDDAGDIDMTHVFWLNAPAGSWPRPGPDLISTLFVIRDCEMVSDGD